MHPKALMLLVVVSLVTAAVVSFVLKAAGLPDGDLHPIITGTVTSVVGAVVFTKANAQTNEAQTNQDDSAG